MRTNRARFRNLIGFELPFIRKSSERGKTLDGGRAADSQEVGRGLTVSQNNRAQIKSGESCSNLCDKLQLTREFFISAYIVLFHKNKIICYLNVRKGNK